MTTVTARRSDARRNRERVLDAAYLVLTTRPQAGLAEVARASGLTRTTVYAHFATREDLLDALVEQAMARALAEVSDHDLDALTPAAALERLVGSSWRQVSAHAALLPVLGDKAEALHATVVRRVRRLADRGRADGTFRSDVPESWLVAVYFSLVHTAGREIAAGTLDDDTVVPALVAVLGDAWRGVR